MHLEAPQLGCYLAERARRRIAIGGGGGGIEEEVRVPVGGAIGIVTLTCAAIVWVAVAPPSQGKPPSATLGVRGTF